MDVQTGEIRLFKDAAAAREAGFVPITRKITAKEQAERQVLLYGPCGCGSGKKFKFCCHVRGAVR